jgi:hypothetical protein
MAHYKTRDYNMVALINGATKAGVHRDNRKHANANACRGNDKMFAARKPVKHDLQIEWTRPAEHGGVEVFDIYGTRLAQGGWHIVRADIIDDDGEPVHFNVMSLSEDEMAQISSLLDDEWEMLRTAFP